MSDNNINLQRFISAQSDTYEQALSELKKGRKNSHWMWYIFPQIKGLGSSHTAAYYGIKSFKEAKAYLAHPILAKRLIECCEVLLALNETSALKIFGSPDNLKLRSSMTLFHLAQSDITDNNAAQDISVQQDSLANIGPNLFQRVIDKFFAGVLDAKTVQILDDV